MDYISDDRKTIIFRLNKLLQIDPDYLSHINDIFSACFNEAEIEIEEGPIIKYIGLTSTEPYDDTVLNYYIGNITSFCTVHVYDDRLEVYNVCSTALGKSLGSAKRLLEEIIILADGKTLMLSLIFDNMYWDRALALYTKLGFVNPFPRYEEKDIVLSRSSGFFSIETARNLANRYREEYYVRNGLTLYKFKFYSRDILDFAEFMLNREKEYTGHFYIDSDKDITQISNMHSGVLIEEMFNAPAFCSSPNSGLLHFHTHPVYTTFQNRLVINHPSEGDINYMLSDCIQNDFRMYVFDLDGLYAISYSPMTTKLFCKHPELIEAYKESITEMYEYYSNLIQNDERDIATRVGNDSDIGDLRRLLTNGYFDAVNQMTWAKLPVTNKVSNFSRENNIGLNGWHVFHLNYIPYSLMMSKSTFQDTVILPNGCFTDENIGGLENHIPIKMPDHYKAVIEKTEEVERTRDNHCKSRGVEFRREYLTLTNNLNDRYKPIFEELVEVCLPYYSKNFSKLLLLVTPQNVQKVLEYIEAGYGFDDIIRVLKGERPYPEAINMFEAVDNQLYDLYQNSDAQRVVEEIRQGFL